MSRHRVIEIQPAAPAKPTVGAPCNGCGVCCLAEPCPLGVLLTRRLHGACAALQWDGTRYRCGALDERAGPLRRWWVRRWIAAGQGCDCTLEPAGKP
ncbi:hypothetical protein [Roseateles sp. BYS87W]|uniref:4Fe-4S ferredoxin-type domain-containing protein n=1 Tax=Pelomonas baiyunensis TaxID=3299026 RepID=A0ABW7GVB3_9BURK